MLNTSLKTALMGAVAAVALNGCGKDDAGDSSGKAAMERPAKLSEASPLDKPFTLKNAEALDVDALFESLGMAGAIEYASATFDDSIGATVLTNVRPAGEEAPMTVGRVEIYGLDSDAVAALKSGEAMTSMEELFRKVRMYDVEGEFPIPQDDMGNGGPSVGKLSIEAVELDSLSVMGLGPDMDEADDEGMTFAKKAKSMAFGGMAMKGLDFAMASPDGADGMGIEAADVRMGGYDDGKFGGIYMADMKYSISQSDAAIREQLAGLGGGANMLVNSPLKNILFPANQSGTVGAMRWDGLSISGLLGYLEKGEKPPVTANNLLSVGGMELTDQTVFINGKKAGFAKRTAMSPIEFHHFMPKQIKVVTEGSVADFTAYAGDENPEILSVLEKNGLNNVEGESTFLYNFDPRAKTIEVESDAEAKGLYNFDFSLDLGNFDYAALADENEEDNQATMMATTLKGMSIRIDDKKLLDTAFAVAGAVTEQDPALLRQQAVGVVTMGALQGGQISPRIPDYATAVSTFLNNGGVLEIKAAPADPVSFGALQASSAEGNPAAMLDTLNLTVSQSK